PHHPVRAHQGRTHHHRPRRPPPPHTRRRPYRVHAPSDRRSTRLMARKKKNPDGTRRPNRASSIFEGSDGYWHGWVTMGVRDDGKPDRRHVKRKSEGAVIKAVRKLEQERDSGKTRKPGRAWTVEQWLVHWVENIAAQSVRNNTLVGYRASVYGYLIPGIGAHRIDKLRPEHLESL